HANRYSPSNPRREMEFQPPFQHVRYLSLAESSTDILMMFYKQTVTMPTVIAHRIHVVKWNFNLHFSM
ncbi:hypothetical protein L2748_17420, partial [Shewanella sairae]|uniref:hypothetical protein n=1 Tax=Shewanella sairae TaxID=190310 RepID=UPI00200E561C